MKNKIIAHLAFFLTAVFLFVSCGKSYIEENQDAYSASDVVPVVLGVTGSTLALQTFSYTYEPAYNRAGSTWSWSATDATISSVSEDTRKATILFDVLPANDTALIKVTETTGAGITSPEKVIKVKVNPFCPLDVAGFVGAWSGTDGMTLSGYYFPSEVVISNPEGTSVDVTGINFGWMVNIWGETIEEGGTISMTINDDGTLVISDQFCFTTDYDGDPYDYNIVGSGTWSNCGTYPSISLQYNIYYVEDGYSLPNDWAGADYPYFYIDIELDGSKGVKEITLTPQATDNPFPPKRK